jgi:hypothetical protein
MCTGAEFMMAGQGIGALSSLLAADTQRMQAKADAAGERDAAQQQAEKILRATERRRVDQWSLPVEQDIIQAGETDAAMTILTGNRRARAIDNGGRMAMAAGLMDASTSLFKAGDGLGGGWRGAANPFDRYTTGNMGSGD